MADENLWDSISLGTTLHNTGKSGGEVVTKPLTFSGSKLAMNFATSAAGSVRVEFQDLSGEPVEGFTLADCPEIFGDQIEQVVTWKSGNNVGQLAGKPVRLRFVLQDADLYSIRFQDIPKDWRSN